MDELNEKKNNLAKLPIVAGLKPIHVGWLCMLIADYGIGQIDLIRQEMEEAFDGLKIKTQIIRQVADLYSDNIDELGGTFEDKIARNPIASRANRLQYLYSIMKRAAKPGVTKGYWKCGLDSYEENKLANDKLAFDCVMAAEKIQADAERFEWQKQCEERVLYLKEVDAGVRDKTDVPRSITKKGKDKDAWMKPEKTGVSMGNVFKGYDKDAAQA